MNYILKDPESDFFIEYTLKVNLMTSDKVINADQKINTKL